MCSAHHSGSSVCYFNRHVKQLSHNTFGGDVAIAFASAGGASLDAFVIAAFAVYVFGFGRDDDGTMAVAWSAYHFAVFTMFAASAPTVFVRNEPEALARLADFGEGFVDTFWRKPSLSVALTTGDGAIALTDVASQAFGVPSTGAIAI